VTVGLPFLDCFLDGNGEALASGAPMPVRFGTWFWGLGIQNQLSAPTRFGPGYDLRGELLPLAPVAKHVNFYSNFAAATDGRPNFVHHTGAGILRCGQAPVDKQALPSETIDVTISDAIGGASRFRSLEATATGNRSHSYSARGPTAVNAPDTSPIALYQRVYGPEFQDPNSPQFTPSADLMLRKSVLSAVSGERARLHARLGAADRARLDEYFTSVRSMEDRLALQLQRPPPAEACTIPAKPASFPEGMDWGLIRRRHDAISDVLLAALTCNQTRVFNMIYSFSAAGTIRQGLAASHHITTHEESKNAQGYQPTHAFFVTQAMEAWAGFVGKLASVREGSGTLLDRTLVYAHSEHGNAQMHSIDAIPVMSAGRAGGRVLTGVHVDGKDQSVAQVGLTMMRAMGLKSTEWGRGSLRTNNVVDGVLA
jgi:hypothetical protein